MKNLLLSLIVIATFVGCGPPHPQAEPKFRVGETVQHKLLDKDAIVINYWSFDNRYRIRTTNDLGEIVWEDVYEYELSPVHE